MRPFDYFLRSNEVKKITPNKEESDSLIEDALHRFNYFMKQEIDDNNSKFIFENIYESIRELLDAILIRKGYKSYSHQAPIVFAANNNIITDKDALILDKLRDLRNKSKYYGKRIDKNSAIEKINAGKEIFKKIKENINK